MNIIKQKLPFLQEPRPSPLEFFLSLFAVLASACSVLSFFWGDAFKGFNFLFAAIFSTFFITALYSISKIKGIQESYDHRLERMKEEHRNIVEKMKEEHRNIVEKFDNELTEVTAKYHNQLKENSEKFHAKLMGVNDKFHNELMTVSKMSHQFAHFFRDEYVGLYKLRESNEISGKLLVEKLFKVGYIAVNLLSKIVDAITGKKYRYAYVYL